MMKRRGQLIPDSVAFRAVVVAPAAAYEQDRSKASAPSRRRRVSLRHPLIADAFGMLLRQKPSSTRRARTNALAGLDLLRPSVRFFSS
jgi:hypothetical protein